MINVIVYSILLIVLLAIVYQMKKKEKIFNSHAKNWDNNLKEFIRVNGLSITDWESKIDVNLKKKLNAPDVTDNFINFTRSNQHKVYGINIDKGFDIIHTTASDHVISPWHEHKFSNEFFYVLNGTINIFCYEDGSLHEFNLCEGDYKYIKSGMEHKVEVFPGSEYIMVIKPPFLDWNN